MGSYFTPHGSSERSPAELFLKNKKGDHNGREEESCSEEERKEEQRRTHDTALKKVNKGRKDGLPYRKQEEVNGKNLFRPANRCRV